jgi:TnpA family transposase
MGNSFAPVAAVKRLAQLINLRYSNEPGVLFYKHISDQCTPFYSKVIAANPRDATYVLDGLLYHESDLRIEEHYTDTAGFTDHVFLFAIYLDFALRLASATWPTNACMFLTRVANMRHLRD